RDLRITNALLYQLSYSSTLFSLASDTRPFNESTSLLYHIFRLCQEVFKNIWKKSQFQLKSGKRYAIIKKPSPDFFSGSFAGPHLPAHFSGKNRKNN
ncbi:MAG: hypothetical protein ACLT2C_10340, partial [Ruminococcus sp.]